MLTLLSPKYMQSANALLRGSITTFKQSETMPANWKQIVAAKSSLGRLAALKAGKDLLLNLRRK